jgi:N12 class adenine-specific DNA methylase
VFERRPNIKPFMSDPESYRIRSIENYNDTTGQASKKEIFTRSVLKFDAEPKIDSAHDGVLWSMNKLGRFDVDAIAGKMGRDKASVIEDLGDAVYKVPGTQETYQTRDEYLSGDVVAKLETARAEALKDPEVRRNVDALEAALPPPLPPSEISMVIGMPWIPKEITAEFVRDHLELGSPLIAHSDVTGSWTVDSSNIRNVVVGVAKWGTDKKPAFEILSDALNRTPPRVYDTVYEDGVRKQVFDPVGTQAAQDKVDTLKAEFSDWFASKPERADGLA